jgi:hypothetical protein
LASCRTDSKPAVGPHAPPEPAGLPGLPVPVVHRRAPDHGYRPGKHAATRQVALLPPTDRPVESLDQEGAEAAGVAVEEAAGLPAAESGLLAAVAPRRWFWRRRRERRWWHSLGQNELPKFELAQIEILTRDAYNPAMFCLKPIGVEDQDCNQSEVHEDGDHQGLRSRGPELQLRVLVQKHGVTYYRLGSLSRTQDLPFSPIDCKKTFT